MNAKEYINPIYDTFYQKMDNKNANQMKKYMKEHFDFLGIKSPGLKKIAKKFLKQYKL